MDTIKIKGIDEEYYYEKLDNGLPVYMLVNKNVNNFYVTFSVKYGSVDTEFKVKGSNDYIKVHDGTAHFLEHVNFNEDEDTTANDYFKKLGSAINAFTSFKYTSYEVMSSDHFRENLEHLLDYVQTPYFTEKLINKEKGIIVEEVKMGKNNPGHKLFYGMNKALYVNDKRRNYITGDVQDVLDTTVEEIQDIYDTFYHPANMLLIITGNFDPKEALKIVKENQNKKKFIEYREPVRKEYTEPSKVNKKEEVIEANVEIPKCKICYKMPLSLFKGMSRELVNIVLRMIMSINFGPISNFREELLKNNLVNYISADRDIFDDTVTIAIDFESKHMDKVIPMVLDKMKNLEVDKESIERRKKCNIASLIKDYDDIEYVNTDMLDQLFITGKINDNFFGMFNDLNMDDVLKVLKSIDLSNYSIVKLVPYK